MMFPLVILSGAFLGWGLGANDSANIFGTAVYSKVVRYPVAVILTGIFVILGALIDGHAGIHEISNYAFNSGIDSKTCAFFVMLAAALTVLTMTLLKLPVSTSQAVIGAIMGGGLLAGKTDFSASLKFLSAWILTPIGGMIFAYIIHYIFSNFLFNKISKLRYYDQFIIGGYIIAGIFGAYSLGANNVANVMGVFAGQLGLITEFQAVLFGGISIALGVLTFSKPVMSTVGEGVMPLSQIEGFIVVLGASITVYIYALIGIPVSTSQAVIGAIIGIGLRVSVNSLDFKILKNILFAWFGTPTVSGFISFLFALFIQWS